MRAVPPPPPGPPPNIAWTPFARRRHRPGEGHAWFRGSEEELLSLVAAGWTERRPGRGHPGYDRVVVVPVPADRFVGTTARIVDGMPLTAEVVRRQAHEEPYVRVRASAPPDPVHHAAVVLYHRDHLALDGPVDFDGEWGIVALLALERADEPMHPLTMARNMLGRPGGSPASYGADELAEAILYWSQRVSTDG